MYLALVPETVVAIAADPMLGVVFAVTEMGEGQMQQSV